MPFKATQPCLVHCFWNQTLTQTLWPREIFWRFMAVWFSKNLGQNLSGVAISGHLERFSPGSNGSEVGRQIALHGLPGSPTSKPFWPGENLSKWPEIAIPLRFCTKFLENHRALNLKKNSRGLGHNFDSQTPIVRRLFKLPISKGVQREKNCWSANWVRTK